MDTTSEVNAGSNERKEGSAEWRAATKDNIQFTAFSRVYR